MSYTNVSEADVGAVMLQQDRISMSLDAWKLVLGRFLYVEPVLTQPSAHHGPTLVELAGIPSQLVFASHAVAFV